MSNQNRLGSIVAAIEEAGYASVAELARRYGVTEKTIRRDLDRLDGERRIRRTHGGAAALDPVPADTQESAVKPPFEMSLATSADVWIISPAVEDLYHSFLETARKHAIPIVGETHELSGVDTAIDVDEPQAAWELGVAVGHSIHPPAARRPLLLDLTIHHTTTQIRSERFLAGLRSVLPNTEVAASLSVPGGDAVFQLTLDALEVYPDINVIFCVSDDYAISAIQACRARGVEPGAIAVVAFGTSSDAIKDELRSGEFCIAGLSEFPEIMGPLYVEAAFAASKRQRNPELIVAPHAVLTPQNLADYYAQTANGWRLRWDVVAKRVHLPLPLEFEPKRARQAMTIGFVVPSQRLSWYERVLAAMRHYAEPFGASLRVVEAEQLRREAQIWQQRCIARAAAQLVQPGDVIFLDGGRITNFLAEEIAEREQITVVTNSCAAFETLRQHSRITVMSTGGIYRRASDTLYGPAAQAALSEMRFSKLFLTVAGVTSDFGLSHTNLDEVAMKQAMINSAREVILLADDSVFGRDSVMQIGPVTLVHRIVTSGALSASQRLELSRLGITIRIVGSESK